MKYNIGDRVLVIPRRADNMPDDGGMDKYLNTIVTINHTGDNMFYPVDNDDDDGYHVVEDNGYYWWYNTDFVCLESEMYQEVE